MHMARQVAAWVAWAAWTCNTRHCRSSPAIAGYGLKESGLRPALFFVVRGLHAESDAGAGFQYRSLIVAWR